MEFHFLCCRFWILYDVFGSEPEECGCVFMCVPLGLIRRERGGSLQTLMSCTLPPSSPSLLSKFLSPSLRSLAGPRCHGSTHIAAGWMEQGALVKKESMGGKGDRSLRREGRSRREYVLQFITPTATPDTLQKKNRDPPPSNPLKPYHWHRFSRAAERPRCCSVVLTRWI